MFYITATDADVGYADEDIVRIGKGWDFSIFKSCILCAVEDD